MENFILAGALIVSIAIAFLIYVLTHSPIFLIFIFSAFVSAFLIVNKNKR